VGNQGESEVYGAKKNPLTQNGIQGAGGANPPLPDRMKYPGYGLFLESFFLFRWDLKLAKSVMTVKISWGKTKK
jgi:hypothetical protein